MGFWVWLVGFIVWFAYCCLGLLFGAWLVVYLGVLRLLCFVALRLALCLWVVVCNRHGGFF